MGNEQNNGVQGKQLKERYTIANQIQDNSLMLFECIDKLDPTRTKIIKIIIPKKFQKMEELKRQYNRIQQLDHKNIVKIYDYFEQMFQRQTQINHIQRNFALFVVVQKIQGKPLSQFIGLLKEHDIIKIYNQMRSALEYLKTKKIVHKEICSNNVILDSHGNVFLSEFRISGSDQKNQNFAITSVSSFSKDKYFAPQIINSNTYGYESDWWALGVILLQLTSGKNIDKITTLRYSALDPNFPETQLNNLKINLRMKSIINNLLRKKPQDRKFIDLAIEQKQLNDIKSISSYIKNNDLDLWGHSQSFKVISFLQYINAKGLLKLSLGCNNIASIEDLTKAEFPKLKKLILRYNKISSIQPLTRVNFPQLIKLDLNSNQIQLIESFTKTNFPKLIQLYICQNRIEDIQPFTRVNFPFLQQLFVKQNKLNHDKIQKYREKIKEKLPGCTLLWL